jgi:hypothetical protein
VDLLSRRWLSAAPGQGQVLAFPTNDVRQQAKGGE